MTKNGFPNIILFLIAHDSLLNLNFSLTLVHVQAYDGASNMLGKDSGVAKRLNDENDKALTMHCLGNCASLSANSIDNMYREMRDCMDLP